MNKTPDSPSKIGVIILAAGLSRRMKGTHKLVKNLLEKPLICHTVAPFIKAHSQDVFIVTGYQANAIKTALSDYDLHFIHNPEFETGMASAIRIAVMQLRHSYDHLMISLGDMPFIEADDIQNLSHAHLARTPSPYTITRARFEGRAGHPVIWGAAYFDQLCLLEGDKGALGLLETYQKDIHYHEMSSAACLTDYDIQEDFDAFHKRRLSLI